MGYVLAAVATADSRLQPTSVCASFFPFWGREVWGVFGGVWGGIVQEIAWIFPGKSWKKSGKFPGKNPTSEKGFSFFWAAQTEVGLWKIP